MDESETQEERKPSGALTAAKLQAEARGLSSLALETLKAIMEGKGQDSVKLAAACSTVSTALVSKGSKP